jgi:hypothetical protein
LLSVQATTANDELNEDDLLGMVIKKNGDRTMRTFKNAALALALPGMLAVSIPAGAMASQVAVGNAASHEDQAWQQHRSRHYQGRYGRGYYNDDAYAARTWRGNDGRYYCRKKDGTVGLIVGGAAGALLGRQIAGRGDHTLGAILGGAGGALLGREIDRSSSSRCR